MFFMGVTESQVLELSFPAFPRPLTEVEQAGHQLVPICDGAITSSAIICCATKWAPVALKVILNCQ